MTQTYKVQVSMNQAHIVESGFVWKQGDFGFNIEIEVLDFDTTGATPQIIFRKSTGAVEATQITRAGNKFTYAIRGTELDTPGPCVCDLKLKDSTTKRVSTASFKYFVIPDTMDGLEQEASSYSDTIAQIISEYGEEVATINGNIANAYNSSLTYNIGDYAIYNKVLYRCKVAITTSEAWNAAHWQAVNIVGETTDIKSSLSETKETVAKYTYNNSSVRPISFTDNCYYGPHDSIVYSNTTRAASEECEAGDIFILNATGGIVARLYYFLNQNGDAIRTANPSQVADNLLLIAPINAKKLIVNDVKTYKPCYAGDILLKRQSVFYSLAKANYALTIFGDCIANEGSFIAALACKKGEIYEFYNLKNGGTVIGWTSDYTTLETTPASYVQLTTDDFPYYQAPEDGYIVFVYTGDYYTQPMKYVADDAFIMCNAYGFQSGKAISSNDGTVVSANDTTASGFIDIEGNQSILYTRLIYSESTQIGIAFYDKNKTFINGVSTRTRAGEAEWRTCMESTEVPSNAKYIRMTSLERLRTNTRYSVGISFSKELKKLVYMREKIGSVVYAAASDSLEVDKYNSHIVCSGHDDGAVITDVLRVLVANGGGKLILKRGRYYLDSETTGKNCVGVNVGTTTVEIESEIANFNRNASTGQEANTGAQFYMSDDFYQSLDSETEHRVFAVYGDRFDGGIILKNFGIVFSHNQKKIVGIDMQNFNGMCRVEGLYVNAYNKTYEPYVSIGEAPQPAVSGCIGIRTICDTSIGAIGTQYQNCIVKGCYEGFSVNSEHTIMDRCAAVFCVYGYTFRHYSIGNAQHPILLVRCMDERNVNFPYFYQNNQQQSVIMIGMNFERKPENSPGGVVGDYAKEQIPGEWRGDITYTGTTSVEGLNENSLPFWEDGHGHGVKTRNLGHLQSVSTSDRLQYKPCFLEQLYDTTLGKPVICIDESVPTWVDMQGNEV